MREGLFTLGPAGRHRRDADATADATGDATGGTLMAGSAVIGVC